MILTDVLDILNQLNESETNITDDIKSLSFIELGLNSLNAFRFIELLSSKLSIELSIDVLFEYPVLGDFCFYLEELQMGKSQVAKAVFEIDQMNQDKEDFVAAVSQLFSPSKYWIPRIPDNILVTGGTGFLGAFIIIELLQRCKGKVYCLVRSESEADARGRLQTNFNKYGINLCAQDRLEVVCGDITKPNLGLNIDDFNHLSQQVGHIIHCAAQVDHFSGYGGLRSVNVQGTFELIRFANSGVIKGISLASSIAVSLMRDDTNNFYCNKQEASILKGDDIIGAYGKSKWVAEKLLEQYGELSKAPVHIFRIGEISGHSQTGTGQYNDIIHSMIRCFIKIKQQVPIANAEVNIIPVDFVTAIMVESLVQCKSNIQFINLSHPHPIPLNRFLELWLEQELDKPTSKTEWIKACQLIISENKSQFLTGLPIFLADHNDKPKFEMYFSHVELCYEKLFSFSQICNVNLPLINEKLIQTYRNYCVANNL